MKRTWITLASLLLAGCGGMSMNMWPFGPGGPAENSRTPVNAAEYQCDGGKRFWVRQMEGGAVWLIAPDRELRLAKAGAEGRYAAGRVSLQLDGSKAVLVDPPGEFTNCKFPEPPAQKK
jgi:hypothetical protein